MTYALSQIPNLPVAISLNGDEMIEAVQGGTSVRVTISQVRTGMTALQASAITVNPTVGGWTNVQDALAGLNTSVVSLTSGKVNDTGDTMSGDLTIAKASPKLILNKPASGTADQVVGQTNGLNRWALSLGEGSTESGSDTGSLFAISRFNDAGTLIDNPFSINRQSGSAQFNQSPAINTVTAGTGANLTFNAPSTLAVNLFGQKAGSNRWQVILGNNTAESGGNTGSDFVINRFNDAGTLIDAPLTINRATGAVTFIGNPTYPSQTAATFLAAPNASAGVPTFRVIIAADLPATLNPTNVIGPTTAPLSVYGGTGQPLQLGVNNSATVWQIDTGGNLKPILDNSRDFGGTATRIKSLYAVNVGSTAAPLTGAWSGTFVAMGSGPSIQINKTASTQTARIIGQTNTSVRWTEYLGDGTAEGGSNVGSDYKLERYTDGGVAIDVPLLITRSTGVATFTQIPVIPTTTPTLATQATSKSFTDATYLPLAGGTLTATTTISNGNLVIQNGGIVNSSATAQMELGATASANSPYIDFHSSGNNIDYDVRLQASGGSASVGAGALQVTGAQFNVSAALRVIGGNTASVISGAAAAKTVLNSTGVFQSTVDFQNSGTTKWQIGKHTDDSFLLADTAAGTNVFTCATGATFNILRSVNVAPLGAANLYLNKSTSGSASTLGGQTGGVNRWLLNIGNATAEGGSNAGSDFTIQSYTDAGASLDTPLTITRSTGIMTLSQSPVVTPVSGSAGITINPQAASQQALISMQQTGTSKWQIGKQTDNTFILYDVAAASNVFNVATNATFIFNRDLTVGPVSARSPVIYMLGVTGTPNIIYGQKGASLNRWGLSLGGSAAETGSNVGSDFAINSYNDAGTLIESPLVITRSTGIATFAHTIVNSDLRLKKNIKRLTGALAKVRELRGVSYIHRTNNLPEIGLIAQEVKEVMPDVVHESPADGMLGVAYANLTALLIEAIKELAAKVEILEARPR